jgi:hypothetical protein
MRQAITYIDRPYTTQQSIDSAPKVHLPRAWRDYPGCWGADLPIRLGTLVDAAETRLAGRS